MDLCVVPTVYTQPNVSDRTIATTVSRFRFAPSSNGALHLGHAYSALLNQKLALESGGELFLRIEDIDLQRCTRALEAAIVADLDWLGFVPQGKVRRQSQHMADYNAALDVLISEGLVYPSFMTRGEIRKHVAEKEALGGKPWPRDPDGAPIYPSIEKTLSQAKRRQRMDERPNYAWRLDLEKVLAFVKEDSAIWNETGAGPDEETGDIAFDPNVWGDVVIARRDVPTSYHLAVTVDDALQGITHVVRGRDLFASTAIHRLLQDVLGFPVPIYHHHHLILGEDGQKLAKSRHDTSLTFYRESGRQPSDIRRMVGLDPD